MTTNNNANHMADANNGNVKQLNEIVKIGSLTPFGEAIKLLRDLAYLLNDAPLEKHRQEWEETMEKVYDFLNKWDANDSNVERQLKEIVKNNSPYFTDVTFVRNSNPINVGEYLALIGFKDQRDAERFATLTNGEFSIFFKKDGQAISYIGRGQITDIYLLAGICHIVFLEGNENLYQLCEKIHGLPLVDYIRGYINNNDVPDAWIRAAVELYETGEYQSPFIINNRDEDVYDEVEDKIFEILRMLNNFKGCKGYVVIDNVNWSVVGEYDTDYPSYYKKDTEHYIFGVMYPIDREEEIREIIG